MNRITGESGRMLGQVQRVTDWKRVYKIIYCGDSSLDSPDAVSPIYFLNSLPNFRNFDLSLVTTVVFRPMRSVSEAAAPTLYGLESLNGSSRLNLCNCRRSSAVFMGGRTLGGFRIVLVGGSKP